MRHLLLVEATLHAFDARGHILPLILWLRRAGHWDRLLAYELILDSVVGYGCIGLQSHFL
jgi:hypothetical protein